MTITNQDHPITNRAANRTNKKLDYEVVNVRKAVTQSP